MEAEVGFPNPRALERDRSDIVRDDVGDHDEIDFPMAPLKAGSFASNIVADVGPEPVEPT